MNKQIVSLTTALAIAAAGGLAYAQSDSSKQAADANGVPGVEMNLGSNAKSDGGLPGVEANIGADGDQKNVTSPDTSTLGAGPTTTETSNTTMQVDRN